MYCRIARSSTLRFEPLGNLLAHSLERQWLARNALVNGHDVKSITRLDELTEDPRRSKPKKRLFKFRHGVAAADLTEIAALLSRWTVGELTRQGIEPVGFAQQIVQRLLGPSAHFRNAHRRRDLEQNVPRVYEIAALELARMTFVVAAAFFLGGRRCDDLPREQGLNRLVDRCLVANLGGQQSNRNGTLPEEFARCSKLLLTRRARRLSRCC